MNEDIDSETKVLLQIDNVAIKCLKQDLIYHSDYFKAMFEGSFVESNKKIVKLEGIDLKAMNIILALLWDRTFLINEEDILSVLQDMVGSEQLDLKPLYLKAKSTALIEFDVIKNLDSLADLQLRQLCCYLGNINLHCKNEMDIFQTCMKWWRSKSRVCKQFACILVNSAAEEQARKKQKTASSAVPYDMFMRKRYYKNIDTPDASLSIIYYDIDKHNFIKFLDVDKEKCANLDGFKMIGYKEFIFLFGGEYLMGKGNWNKNFWVYDVVREGWERKSVLPFVRRHFESCICGNYLYIIGGTGNFRVIQHNMFWYNYKDDKWSGQIELPCVERQLKCCCWNEQLFILSITSKCGYVFDCNKSLWYKLSISA
ncbi:hypothetical protein FQR65_LT01691 [Abscondita terminalis]|nr:hypothetical protein FQR65_LT01691 [Abscondita terminalis]